MKRIMLLVGIAVGIVAMCPLTAHATFPGPNGKIAFVSDRDGNPEIYVIDPDGSNLSRLTNTPQGEEGPQWSPDGRTILFGSNRDGSPDLYVMNADGTNPRRLTNTPENERSVAWSPDGTKIAFASDDPDTGAVGATIYAMNADGSAKARITPGFFTFGPAWSPNSDRIAWAVQGTVAVPGIPPDLVYDIYASSPDGSTPTLVSSTTYGPAGDPSRPHAAELVWYPQDAPHVVGTTVLTGRSSSRVVPMFAPDGVSSAEVRNDFSIQIGAGTFTLSVEETAILSFQWEAGGECSPAGAWSPDSSQFVVVRPPPYNGGQGLPDEGIYVIRRDGTGLTRVIAGGACAVSWQPLSPEPKRGDFKNSSHYCKALREFLGDAEFSKRYKNHGNCVSASH